jgi:hypothetical protein
MSDNTMPTERELAGPEKELKARERGIRLGYTGQFLDHFIEQELRMMQKWDNRKQSRGR